MAVFTLEDSFSVWTNLGKHSLFVWLLVSSIKKGARRIIRLDELSRLLCDLRERTMVMNAAGLSENTLNFDVITKKATFQLGWKNWESMYYQFLYLK